MPKHGNTHTHARTHARTHTQQDETNRQNFLYVVDNRLMFVVYEFDKNSSEDSVNFYKMGLYNNNNNNDSRWVWINSTHARDASNRGIKERTIRTRDTIYTYHTETIITIQRTVYIHHILPSTMKVVCHQGYKVQVPITDTALPNIPSANSQRNTHFGLHVFFVLYIHPNYLHR